MGFEMKVTGSDGTRYKSMADALEADVKQMIDGKIDAVKRAIERERCTSHNRHAAASVKRQGDQITFEINACCDELRKRAQAAASRVR